MRLLTYNMHKGIGGRDRRYRLHRILETIDGENPDLILLQEVDRNVRRSRFDNQPQLLAKHFALAASLFQLNVHLKRGGYGNLILSRWPFETRHQVSLTWRGRKNRGAQIVVITTPTGSVQVVNLHLGLSERERHWQVDHLLTHRLFQEADRLPSLIAGDFNDWRNTLHRPFAEGGFRHVTGPPSRFRSFPAYFPVGALDKAFARGPITVRRARVVKNRTSRVASDHLPLVVDFAITNSDGSGSR